MIRIALTILIAGAVWTLGLAVLVTLFIAGMCAFVIGIFLD